MKSLKYAVEGTTDERTDCDCCGRSNLKSTVVLRDLESGDFVFFGVTCAAKAQGWTNKEVKSSVDAARVAKTKEALHFAMSHRLYAQCEALRPAERKVIEDCRVPYAERQSHPDVVAYRTIRAQLEAEVLATHPITFRDKVNTINVYC